MNFSKGSYQLSNNNQNEFINTLAHLAQHIVNISYEERNLGRRIFVINHVGNKKKCNLKDVVNTLKLPKSTATRQVDYLVKNDIINRTIPGGDRRTVELQLTSRGEKIYSWFQNHLTYVITTMREEFSDKELDSAMKILPTIVDCSESSLRSTGHWRHKQK